MTDVRLSRAKLRSGVALATGRQHTLVITRKVSRLRLVGMFFDLNKCFLLPAAMNGIRELKRQFDATPGRKLLIVGHADTSGKDDYNLTLSLERADAVSAFVSDRVDSWEAFFDQGKPTEKRWGLLEVQHMLTVLPERGSAFFSGKPNGIDNSASRTAVRAFQETHGLDPDGVAGPITRAAIIRAYMGLDGTTLPEETELTTHGCGENFPVNETGGNARSPENRRVEIFFFEEAITPEPPGKTSARGSTAYPRWRKQVTQTVDIVLGTASAVAGLESRYALERFEQLAADMRKEDFIGWASVIYGTDIPVSGYESLREALVEKSLTPPEIQLVPGGVDGKDSAYDNATQIIAVREEIALGAKDEPSLAGELIVLLMHEFGHHVDHLLRRQFSNVGGDAPGEEGNSFAYGVTALHHVKTDHVPFATLTRKGQSVELALDFPEFHRAAQTYLADPQARQEAMRETVEFFGAGRGNPRFPKSSFGHRSIEDGLEQADPVFFKAPIRDQIYFGNWLRDFSQVNDPGWLRFLKNGFGNAIQEAEDLVVELMDIAAKKDFDPSATPAAHEAGFFRVTAAKLGVYRPEEHMDNPEGIQDGSGLDPRFRGPVAPVEIAIDPRTGLKAYIKSSGSFVTSANFIDRSLRAAVTARPTPEGRRLFGQALHTLEDLFAHSNFVELALIRLGHTSVFAWVGDKARIPMMVDGKLTSRIPMVTGVFGLVDTGVSGASILGEALEKPIECIAGEFSSSSVAIIKLLRAVTPDRGEAVEALFTQLKLLEKKYPKYVTFICDATDELRLWLRAKLGTAIREQLVLLHRQEEAFFNNPTSTAPTHSQLAKDHDDHPLHTIAADCARNMVADVGLAMRDAWAGSLPVNGLVDRALRYLVHPDDVALASSAAAGPQQILSLIQAFAATNPGIVKSLDFATSKARFLKQSHAERERRLDEARSLYARNEVNADRTAELIAHA
ncbi:MAG: HET-C-related protein [Myxococcaceae bacterium]